MKILIKRTEGAKEYPMPIPKKPGDVGFDLYTVKEIVIPARNELPIDIPTGVCVKLPSDVWAFIVNRSSTPRRLGIEVVSGLIDNGYTGELFACCYNRTQKDIVIPKGTRLAQFVIFSMIVPEIEEVNEFPDTERGESGFGSTGN